MPRILWLLPAAILVLPACASSGSEPRVGARNLISEEELVRHPNENAFEAIQRLRPRWLATRGRTSIRNPEAGQPVVYVDGIRYGDVNTLRGIRTQDIAEIKYESASDATTMRGTGHSGGVILITTKKG